MKRFVFLSVFISSCLLAFSQTEIKTVCQYGFTFEISMQKSWGYAQPVVLTVAPSASAEAAGLQVDDIIEKINGKPTSGENIDTIIDWLQNSNNKVQLIVSNLRESHQPRTLNKYCHLNNLLTEKDLAEVYSFYSLEDAQTRTFACPFKTAVNPESDLLQYASFGFAVSNSDNPEVEKTVNAAIRKSLEQKGLKYSDRNPDLIVKTQYSRVVNPNFRNIVNADKLPVACRYNVNTNQPENLPIYYNSLIHSDRAKFFLKFGIQLIDNKKKSNTVVWECNAGELLKSDYAFSDYAVFHIPLMFMQYPYPKSFETAQFYYGRSKYNYTGISYNTDNLKEIADVIPSSPAAEAGIRPGDIVEKINDIKFINNPKTLDSNYKQFILKTSQLRDPKTQFTNAEGFTRCMYWDKMKSAEIENEFRKPEYSTVFSYLFYFRPYINLSETNIVTFSIKRGNRKEEIKVTPRIVSEEVFESQ